MKRSKIRIRIRIRPLVALQLGLSLLALSGFVAGCGSSAPSAVIDEIVTPDESVVAYFVLPDFGRSMGQLDELAAGIQRSEGAASNPVRSMLWLLLGDYGVENIDGTRPIVAAVLRGAESEPAMETAFALAIPAKSQISLAPSAAKMFGLTSGYSDNLLLATKGESIGGEPAVRDLYAKLESSSVASSARFYVHTQRLGDAVGERIDAALGPVSAGMRAMLAATEDTKRLAEFIDLEFGAIRSIAAQMLEVQCDVNLTEDEIDLGFVMAAEPGSGLADYFSSSSTVPAETSDLLPDRGVMRAVYGLHAESLVRLAESTLADMAKNSDFKDAAASPMAQSLIGMTRLLGRQAAMTVDVGEGLRFHWEAFFDLTGTDEQLVEEMEAYVETIGKISGSGEMSIVREKRTHESVVIHGMTGADSPREDRPLRDVPVFDLMPSSEFAAVKGKAVMATDEARMNELIDRVRTGRIGRGAPLAAQERYGEGRHFYIDYDFLTIVREILGAEPGFEEGAEELPESAPMLVAGTFGKGLLEIRLSMPTDLARSLNAYPLANLEAGSGR